MASHGNGYTPPSLDQTLTFPVDDPFINATAGLDDIVEDTQVPSADVEAPTASLLQFTDSELGKQSVTGKIGQQQPGPSGRVPPVTGVPLTSAPEPVLTATGGDDSAKYSRFNIKYYRTVFDVDTSPVFLEKHGERPDLYGPFWISTTIVFLIAVVSNYIGWYNHGAKSGEAAWKYDTDKVTYAGVLFYGYVGVIGFAIWATLRWFKAPTSLAQIWCVYGYGMAVFIPVSILCAIPSALASWLLVCISTAASGLFILLNLRLVVFEHTGPKAVPLYIAMACCHAALGVALKLYFFRYASIKHT